jgi:hypothetical protein
MKRILIAALFAVACGGSSNEGTNNQQTGGTTQQPPPTLDSNFSGTWNGTTTLTFTGNQPSVVCEPGRRGRLRHFGHAR